MKRGPGQWNAYCEHGWDMPERKRRLAEVPEELREQVRIHLNTVHTLAKRKARHDQTRA